MHPKYSIAFLLFALGCVNEEGSHAPTVEQIKSESVLVFEDLFDGNSLDTAKWFTTSTNPKPFDRILPRAKCDYDNAAIMLEKNILVENGNLNLIARYEQGVYKGIVEGGKNLDMGCGFLGQDTFSLHQSYSSATIQSKTGYNHGYFECRAKIPNTVGLYPVLWLWHHDEIVVFEFFGNSKAHFVSAHKGANAKSKEFNQVEDYSDDFHIYAVNWTPKMITWYLDDQEIWTLDRIENAPENPEDYFFPDSLDRWLAPNISLRIYEWTEDVNFQKLPDTLQVDYIKIYQKK